MNENQNMLINICSKRDKKKNIIVETITSRPIENYIVRLVYQI